jgi:flagellar biosynthesis protein FlhB
MAEEDQDKSLPATPFKLQEARKRGQVAKSLELNSWLILSSAFLIFYFSGPELVASIQKLSYFLLDNANQLHLSLTSSSQIFTEILNSVLDIFWPMILVLTVTGIMASLIQIGPIFTFNTLKPDFKRLNPVTGFKRLFSKKMLFEAFKTIIKFFLIILISYFVLKQLLPKLLLANRIDPHGLLLFIRSASFILLFTLISLFFFIAILDIIYVRFDYSLKMRMSSREVKDEVKRREGDPHIKSKRRQLQKEYITKVSSLGRVPNADFIVTNPEHIAVAIQYDRATMAAPTVISKGSDKLAQRIKQIAIDNGLILVENKPVARKLYSNIGINQVITPDLFPDIAKILLWVYSVKNDK